MTFVARNTCRICNNSDLVTLFDLGQHSIGSRFPKENEDSPPCAPLILVKCNDVHNPDNCGLVQLQHDTSQAELYTDNYGYRSGLNDVMVSHLKEIVKEIEETVFFEDGDIVLDIGCNDGTLLKCYSHPSIIKVGIDPSGLQFKEFYADDIILVPEYFSRNAFTSHMGCNMKTKVVTSISMFYDLPDPMSFVRDVYDVLTDDGIWVMEQSYLPLMLANNSFDTICHEHLEYYAIKQIKWMCDKIGFHLLNISTNDCNGGSFRVTIGKQSASQNMGMIQSFLEKENTLQLNTLKPYENFVKCCHVIKELLVMFLNQQNENGKKIAVYGASTKGNTLLQYFDIDKSFAYAAAERNPRKYGCRTPGTDIPIMSEEKVRDTSPDYYLALPWHFKGEFIKREDYFLRQGGKFIFPLPDLQIVGHRDIKVAAVLGASGQIGTYLCDLLLSKGYHVYGIGRHPNVYMSNIKQYTNIICNICEVDTIHNVLLSIRPDEVYNLAAETTSWKSNITDSQTTFINGQVVVQMCSVIQKLQHSLRKPIKFLQANSIEIYKGCREKRVDESFTNFHPRTAYGIGKLTAYWAVRNYREMHKLFYCSAILSNTESRYRKDGYVTSKIIKYAKDKKYDTPLMLGDVSMRLDWIHAKDVADGMWMIMQQSQPRDYIISTNKHHTIIDFIKTVFKGVKVINGKKFVYENNEIIISDPYVCQRPYELGYNGATKFVNNRLRSIGWTPKHSSLDSIVEDMMHMK